MSEKEIKRVAIIGSGQMGSGIGIEFARYGFQVTMQDRSDEILKRSLENMQQDLDLMVETELITVLEAKASLARVKTTTDLTDAVRDADHVVEAIPEILTLKQQIFVQLDNICPEDVTLATNSSFFRAEDCAVNVKHHPERILITHYWNPAPFMPLVEVIGGKRTDPKYLDRLAKTLKSMHKRVVVQKLELPSGPAGWGNALQHPMEEIARKLVDEKGCEPQVVDELVRFGFGRRMSFIAFFLRYDIMGLDFFAKGPLGAWKPMKEHIDRGEIGTKSGKGFYDWPPEKANNFNKDYMHELIHLMKKDMERGDI